MESYDPILEKWLSLGAKWLNSLLSQGVIHISNSTQDEIERWAQHAHTLGFAQQADLAKSMLDPEITPNNKSKAFHELLFQQDLYQKLYYAEQLEKLYVLPDQQE